MCVSILCDWPWPIVATGVADVASSAWEGLAMPAADIIPSTPGALDKNGIVSRRLSLIAHPPITEHRSARYPAASTSCRIEVSRDHRNETTPRTVRSRLLAPN